MSQFSLYQNNDKGTATAYPYFVDVQSEMLDTLNTRLVIPLTPVEMLEKKAPVHLCPVIHIDEGDFVILTHQMASVPNKILRDPVNELSTFRN
ncbi:CcdB family protein, partial [Vibrio breoganii]